ncbi:MAG: hypothetical protein H7A01_14305 [Hahellaceae bacterium]|nr:hypothetical protein [Hahellaceae bacterium]MCP5210229.1 hypothetical protein [Hahellaceae bacterium]
MNEQTRLMFTRPLSYAIGMAVALELINFILFAWLPGTNEQLLAQFIWMVGIGGIGMGAVLGVLLDVIVVGRLSSREATLSTVMLSFITLGLVAKLVTLNMAPVATSFTMTQWPVTYFLTGAVLSCLGGYGLGRLLFETKNDAQAR